MRIPVTFPPKSYDNGHLLSGLGVPDLSGRIGKPFYFTSELFFTPKGGGDFKVEVVELVDNKGEIETEIKGPQNELFPEQSDYIKIPMKLTVADDKKSLRIQVSGNDVTLKSGQWSDWGTFHVPVQLDHQAQGHRPVPRAVHRARGAALSLVDPVRSENLPPGFDNHGAGELRRRSDP
jgi:hypothetical protein